MANFFVVRRSTYAPAIRSTYKNMSSSSLAVPALYTLWIFLKKSHKVLRSGSHLNGFPKPLLTPRREFHPFA